MATDSRWNEPPDLPRVLQLIKSGKYSWNEIIDKKFSFGGPVSIIQNDLFCVHQFTFDEIWLLRNIFNMEGIDYLKALYKMEIISRLRICALISSLKKHGYYRYLNNLKKREIQAVGVFFGSTGRFEATESSDYEFIFLRRDIDFTTKHIKREFNEKMMEISNLMVEELSPLPEFEGSHPCGTITDYGVKRSWDFMYNNRRPMLVAYLFSYCFFSEPTWLHNEMKRSCLINFGIDNIIEQRKSR